MTGPQIIVLSGLDGSGKSSHMYWIAAALAARNQPYRYVRLRWAALTSIPLLGLARVLGYSRWEINPRSGTRVPRQRYDEFPLMRIFWPTLFRIDFTLAARRKVLSPLARGEWVLCDRYAPDAIVDVAAMLHDPALVRGAFAARLLRLMPNAARALILEIDPLLAYERKRDVLSLDYLRARQSLYRELAERSEIPVVDGNRSFAEVQESVAAIVGVQPLPEHRGLLAQNLA
jgi:thymidylate kinase